MIEPKKKTTFDFSKRFGKNNSNIKQKSSISYLGILINIVWIISTFLQPPLEATLFLGIGLISLLITTYIRLYTRFRLSSQYSDIEGGGILGFVVASIIANSFYPMVFDTIILLETTFTVSYILQIYIIIVFLIWFIIPTSPASQDVIFGLPSSLSYLVLNFWKLLILIKIFAQLEPSLFFLNPSINAIILLFAYFELILLLFRQKSIQILDIILDIQQVFIEILRGPGQAIKWSFIIFFFLIFDMVEQDFWMLSIIAISIMIGFVSFTSMLARVGNSGIFSEKLESGKALAPTIFNEISHIEPENLHRNFYSVPNSFIIKTKTKVIRFKKGNTIFRIPLTNTLEDVVGVYVATIHLSPASKKSARKNKGKFKGTIIEDVKKDIKNGMRDEDYKEIEKKLKKPLTKISVKSVRKFTFDEWKTIKSNTILLPSDEALSKLGFKSQDEFNARIQKGLTGIIGVQEQIRARVRGLPAISGDPNKYTIAWHGESHITIPKEILDQMSEKGAIILELIPGKEEFLFYVKIR